MTLGRLRCEDKNDRYASPYLEGEALSLLDAHAKGGAAALVNAKKDEQGNREIEILEITCLGEKRF